MKLHHRFKGLEYSEAAKFTVNFKDVFSLKYIYMVLHEWLIEEGYATRDDETFPEVYYLQKENPAFGKEIWWRWRMTKNPYAPGKSKFWKFMMDIDVHVLGLGDAEVMVKDKKIKVNKGEIEFQVAAYILTDASKEWEDNAWLKPFKKIYLGRIAKSKKEELKRQLYNETYRLQDVIKTYFKLESFLPEKEGEAFWSKRTGE